MALIKCYECGKEISDKAPSCPHCGAPKLVATNKKVKTKKSLVFSKYLLNLDQREVTQKQ